MKKIVFLLSLIFFVITDITAQAPANDACAGSETVTPDGTCYGGTTVGAADHWQGTVGCQSGNNHADVWYTFTATGSQLIVNVTSGTIGGNLEFILVEATGACDGFSLAGSLCGASVLTGTINGLQLGSLYYYTISSSGADGTFTTCVNNVTPPPVSGQDCATAAILCNGNTFSQAASTAGFGIQEVNPANSCWVSGGERQSKWFKFTVGCSGTLEFNINPVDGANDYDWSLWNTTTLGCPVTTNTTQIEIACNWSGCKGSTGITTCLDAVGEPGRVASGAGCGGGPAAWNIQTLNVTAGNTYALLVDNFSATNNGFSLTFGGACGGGTAVLGPDAAFTFTSPSCGNFTFTKTCQTINSTFLWVFGDGTTSTLQNPTKTYTTSGTYIVSLSVTDALGCLITTSQTIFVGIPTSNAGPDLTLCSIATGTIGAAATAGYTYSWSPSTGLSSTTVSNPSFTIANTGTGAITTVYTVTTTASGCTSTDAMTLTVNPSPTITVNSPTICSGTSTVLTANGGAVGTTYTWSPGTNLSATTGSAVTSSATTTIQYTVTATLNGCSSAVTSTVTVNDTPTTTASPSGNITCITPTITLSSTLAGANYTWTAPSGGILGAPNSQNTTASGASGTYSLFVQNAAGCAFSTTTSVTQNTTVPTGVNAGSDQTLGCGSATVVTLTGSATTPGNATASWSGPSVSGSTTSFTTTANGAGIYTLTATDPSNGCTDTSMVQVFANAGAPTLTVNPVTNTITCTNTLVTVSISTTVSPVTFNWSGTGIVGTTTLSSISVTQGGTFNYTLTNTTNSCTASGNTVVVQNTTPPPIDATTTGTLTCSASTVNLSTTVAGMNYTWTAPIGGSVSTPTNQSTVASGVGDFSLTIVNPSNGCSSSTITMVTQNITPPSIDATTTGTLTCSTSTVNLSTTVTGMNYTWTAPIGGSVSTPTNQSTIASGVGDFSLTIVNPSNGCPSSTITTVTQNITQPTGVSAGSNQTLTCPSNSVTLTGSVTTPTNATVNWTGASVCGTPTTIVTSACVAGDYTLTVTDPLNGCTTASVVTVSPNAGTPIVTISSPTLVIDCNNAVQSVTVTSTPSTDVTYVWNTPPATLSADGSIASFANTNTYIATVTNTLSACSETVQVIVTSDMAAPSISITPNQTLTCANPTAVISTTTNPISGITYTWAGTGVIGQTTNSVVVNSQDVYTVTITNAANGCTNTATAAVSSDTNVPVATITASSSNSIITCQNVSVTLSVSVLPIDTYTYTWSSGGTGITENVTAPIGYTVTVINSSGCTASAPYTVTSNTNPPSVSVTNTVIPCGSPSVTIGPATSSATNVSYTWTTSGTGSLLSVTNMSTAVAGSAGQYEVTVTDNDNGCTNTGTVNVTSTGITAAFTANPLSGTAPLLVNFTNQSTPGSVYSWNFADNNNNTSTLTDPSHIFNTPGNYIVMLTAADASGLCSATATLSIEVFENATVIIPNVFTPNRDGSNDLFKITTTGIKELTCDIFNRWGTKLYTLKSENDSWDGTGSSEGTYFFILQATGLDGKEFKQQGYISLFR